MSNLHVYHNNIANKNKVKFSNINITTSPLHKKTISYIKFEKDSLTPNNRNIIHSKIKQNKNASLRLGKLKSVINTESTFSKTDEDEEDILRFKFLLNKLLKNPKSKVIVMNEIKSVINNETEKDKNTISKKEIDLQEGVIIAKKTLSFNVNTFKNIESHKLTSPIFKYKNLRLIKDNRKQLEDQISLKRSTHSRNELPLTKSKTLIRSIEIPSLDLQTIISKNDFNNEFISKADDFSPSWREDCIKANILN